MQNPLKFSNPKINQLNLVKKIHWSNQMILREKCHSKIRLKDHCYNPKKSIILPFIIIIVTIFFYQIILLIDKERSSFQKKIY